MGTLARNATSWLADPATTPVPDNLHYHCSLIRYFQLYGAMFVFPCPANQCALPRALQNRLILTPALLLSLASPPLPLYRYLYCYCYCSWCIFGCGWFVSVGRARSTTAFSGRGLFTGPRHDQSATRTAPTTRSVGGLLFSCTKFTVGATRSYYGAF